ncbi:MAG TPA: hypothetical protein P5527_05695 [Kiritimatiellia bacterium]|nr:hypothetical protein [Kiritimatiellia bacterium]
MKRTSILITAMIAGAVTVFGRTVEVTVIDLEAGSVSFAFGAPAPGEGDKTLFAAWNPNDAGQNVADWRETAYIATVAPATDTLAYTIPETWRKRSGAVRFFLTPPRPYAKRLSYLRTASAGPWIDTGIVPDTNTDVSVRAYYPGDMAPFGVSGKLYLFCASGSSSGTYYYGFFGTSGSFWDEKNRPRTLRINATGAFLDGDCKARFNPADLTTSTSSTMTLFARRVDGASGVAKQGNCTIYTAQIMTNGVPARDYVPCLKTDNTPALYDRVTGTFFVNAGTGTFTQGDDIGADPVDCGEAEAWTEALKFGRSITMTGNNPFLGTATLALGDGDRDGLLFAVGGATDAGTTVSDWQNIHFLTKVPAGTNSVEVSLPAAWWDDAAKVRFFWRSAEDFPYDRQVAFLASDGGPWINTGYIPGPGTEISVRQRTAYDVAFGLTVYFYLFSNGAGTHYGYFGDNGFFDNYNPRTAVHDLTLGPTGAYLNGELKVTFTNTTYTPAMTKGISLFGRRDWQTGDVAKRGWCQIYAAQIREGGVTVRDFVPCVSNGVACLYDRISRSFCFNAGSGAFETGDTVTPETADSDALVWSDVASLASAVSAIWDAGGGNDTSFATAANWADDTVPDFANGSAAVSFATDGTEARLGQNALVRGIRFHATNDFQLSAAEGAKLSVGSGGITLKSSDTETLSFWRYFTLAAPTEVATDQTWDLSTNVWRRLQLIDDLSGASNRTLTVTGSGTLGFYATNSFAGSIHIKSGVMKLFSQERLFGSANSGGVVIVDQTTGAEWNQFGAVVDKPVFVTAADVSAGRFYTGASYGTNWFTAPITVGDNTFNWAIYGDTVIAGGATFGTRVRFTEGASLSIRDTPIFAKEIEMWDAKELHLEVPSNRIWSIGFSYWQTKPGNQIHCWAASVFAHYDTSLMLDKSTTFHLHGYDQNLSNLRINDAGSCVTSDVPAQLYAVQRDYNAVFKGTFQGAVDYAKSGGYTVTLAGTNTSQGSLSVVNGQLAIAPEGCWAGTNVVVGSDVSSIAPTLRLQGGQSFTDPKNTVITMITAPNGTTPRIQLDEGVDQTVGWLWLDGARLGMGTWGSTSSAATHQDDTHFAGTGILTVRGDGGGTLITIR